MKYLIIWTLIVVLLLFTILNRRVYYCVFEHKKWRLWRHFIRNYSNFKFEYEIDGAKQYINEEGVRAVIWEDGNCSIHYPDNDCVLSMFSEYHSRKMGELLSTLPK